MKKLKTKRILTTFKSVFISIKKPVKEDVRVDLRTEDFSFDSEGRHEVRFDTILNKAVHFTEEGSYAMLDLRLNFSSLLDEGWITTDTVATLKVPLSGEPIELKHMSYRAQLIGTMIGEDVHAQMRKQKQSIDSRLKGQLEDAVLSHVSLHYSNHG